MEENDHEITCTICGSTNRQGAVFCRSCGANLAAASDEHAADEQESKLAARAAVTGEGEGFNSTIEIDMQTLMDQHSAELGHEQHVAAEESQPETAAESGETNAGDLEEIEAPEFAQPIEVQSVDSANPDRLRPGDRLNHGRYLIVDRLEPKSDQDGETARYSAHDYFRCGACRSEYEAEPTGEYCDYCGAEMSTLLTVEITQLVSSLKQDDQIGFEEGGVYYLVTLPDRYHQTTEGKFDRGVRLQYGYQSDLGEQREIDEDSVLAMSLSGMFEGIAEPTLGLFAVADGIGGHEAGEVASRKAIQQFSAEVLDTVFKRIVGSARGIDADWLAERLEHAVHKANENVYELNQQFDLGTTITAALVYNNLTAVANVGDSRTYLWRDGELTQITEDHSMVASLIAAKQLEPEEIYTHEQKGMIFRSLGDRLDLKVDTFTLELKPKDRLILCCDGVWEMIRDEGIEQVMLEEHDPQLACNKMVRRSNVAGGEDNISVIVVVVEAA